MCARVRVVVRNSEDKEGMRHELAHERRPGTTACVRALAVALVVPCCEIVPCWTLAPRETHGYMDTIQILHTLGIEDTDTHRVKYLGYGYSSPLSI